MADNNGGKDPITSTAGSLFDGVVSLLKMGLSGAIVFGLATGLVPKVGNIFSVLDIGAVIGSIFNSGANTFTSVFMSGDSMQKLKKVNGEALSEQRPQQQLREPSNTLPVGASTQSQSRTQTSNVSGQSESITYVDTTGEGFVSIEEIAAQNKTRKP